MGGRSTQPARFQIYSLSYACILTSTLHGFDISLLRGEKLTSAWLKNNSSESDNVHGVPPLIIRTGLAYR